MYIFPGKHCISYFGCVLAYLCVDVNDVCRYELRMSLRTRKKRYAYQFAAIISYVVDVLIKGKARMATTKSAIDMAIDEIHHQLIGSIQDTMRKLCVNGSMFTEARFEYVRSALSCQAFECIGALNGDYLTRLENKLVEINDSSAITLTIPLCLCRRK